MSDVLDRIDGVLLEHSTEAARAWVYERIDEDMARGYPDAHTHHVRPMFEVLTEDWGADSYEYRADVDSDPLATWDGIAAAESVEVRQWSGYAQRWVLGLQPVRESPLQWSPIQWPSIQADAFTQLMSNPNRTLEGRAIRGAWLESLSVFGVVRSGRAGSQAFTVEVQSPNETAEQVADYAPRNFAAVDMGRPFTWPPPERPDPRSIDLPAPELPQESPRTGPARKANS